MNDIRCNYFNKGVRSLGIETVLAYLAEVDSVYSNMPMVSIGSGFAAVESTIPSINWILVDPNPMSYFYPLPPNGEAQMTTPFIKPDFSHMIDLARARPSIISNCTMFLNWLDPNDSCYDVEAVNLLKPRAIVAIIEKFCGSNGAAGGMAFHYMMDDPDGEYFIYQSTKLQPQRGSDRAMDIRIVWLQRKQQPKLVKPLPCDLPAYVTSNIPYDPKDNCSIM